ncbi:MAG: DUF4403 family protein [Xanthobacteraceae bacterium]
MCNRRPLSACSARHRRRPRLICKRRSPIIDLKPFAADAKMRIAAAVGNLAAQAPGLRANATVDDLRLTGIAYDDKTLRIIANAGGSVNVAISSLSMQ